MIVFFMMLIILNGWLQQKIIENRESASKVLLLVEFDFFFLRALKIFFKIDRFISICLYIPILVCFSQHIMACGHYLSLIFLTLCISSSSFFKYETKIYLYQSTNKQTTRKRVFIYIYIYFSLRKNRKIFRKKKYLRDNKLNGI